MNIFENPFKPGAGHLPPYLAGREEEKKEFEDLLNQKIVSKNLILTGLRGIGKTVLLETLKPIAQKRNWLWAGTDLSESASVSEESLATRIIADLSLLISGIKIGENNLIGFTNSTEPIVLSYEILKNYYNSVPGLVSDKLKALFELSWTALVSLKTPPAGVVFAYDEAQTLSDHPKIGQFPLSVLLDIFQSTQRKEIPFILVLTGLPTLNLKLVEARTYSERLFRVLVLDKLDENQSRAAILTPIADHPLKPGAEAIKLIIQESGGYPYFIQFIGREAYDFWVQQVREGVKPSVPIDSIIQKLDNDFFAARWAKATPRQRELMIVASILEQEEFTPKEVAVKSRELLQKPFSESTSGQTLFMLLENGLIYKNRRGSYSFAVPLLNRYIKRKEQVFIKTLPQSRT